MNFFRTSIRVIFCISLLCLFFEYANSQEKSSVQKNSAPSFQFTDVTALSGIHFEHTVSPEKKYLYESIAGGVLLLDYDRDGWLDIYFTNSPSVDMALHGKKAKSALYRNN